MKQRWALAPAAALCALIPLMVTSGCDNPPPAAVAAAPEVKVMTLKAEALDVSRDLPGRTSAFRIAEVRPQVSGILRQRLFTEGADVQAGDVLYRVDPAPYRAALQSAKGALAQAQASAAMAAVTLRRYQPLLGTRYISQQDYDQAQATAEQTRAAVQVALATVQNAEINLNWSRITAPIAGRIGRSSVTEGALVQDGQTDALATIQQLDPLYVDVTQSADDLQRLQREMTSGQLRQVQGKAQVRLLLAGGQMYAHPGTLEFSDVTVDQTTGSVTLRATIPNPQHQLLPGMFVRARLEEGVNAQALLVPQQAISRNPRGDATTLVVGADNKVMLRTVIADQAVGDRWLIRSGLMAGERVIVSGQQRVQPGVTVKPSEITGDSRASLATPPVTS